MHGTLLTIPPELPASPGSGDEPKKHVNHVDPRSALHANDARVAFRVFGDVHLAKDAEKNKPQEPDNSVNVEEIPAADLGHHPDDCDQGGDGTTEDGVDPFGVGVFSSFGGFGEVLRVETDDDNAHDELEEADDDAGDAFGADIGEN